MKHPARTFLKRNKNGESSNHGYELKRENYVEVGLSEEEVFLRRQKNSSMSLFMHQRAQKKKLFLQIY